MRGREAERRVVAVFALRDEALLLERVGQVAVRVREVGLQLDGAPVRVDRQVDQAERETTRPVLDLAIRRETDEVIIALKGVDYD